MNAEPFTRDHFLAGQNTFGLHIQTDGGTHNVNCLDDTVDDLTHQLVKMLDLGHAFRFADTLLDDLAGSLSSHTAKIRRGGVDHNHATHLCIGVGLQSILEGHLGAMIEDVIDNFLFSKDGKFACLEVDLGFNSLTVRGIDCLAICRSHGRFQCLDDDILGQLFFFQNLVKRQIEFVLHPAISRLVIGS
jgi:hypothetical protein